MSILSEDVFTCLKCGANVVYEPLYVSIEKCRTCGAEHRVTVPAPIIELVEEDEDE